MKKKYFTPEMEEVSVNEPVVLDMQEGSGGNLSGCPTEQCNEDNCPEDFE
jgi:hypothetical protein